MFKCGSDFHCVCVSVRRSSNGNSINFYLCNADCSASGNLTAIAANFCGTHNEYTLKRSVLSAIGLPNTLCVWNSVVFIVGFYMNQYLSHLKTLWTQLLPENPMANDAEFLCVYKSIYHYHHTHIHIHIHISLAKGNAATQYSFVFVHMLLDGV